MLDQHVGLVRTDLGCVGGAIHFPSQNFVCIPVTRPADSHSPSEKQVKNPCSHYRHCILIHIIYATLRYDMVEVHGKRPLLLARYNVSITVIQMFHISNSMSPVDLNLARLPLNIQFLLIIYSIIYIYIYCLLICK